MAQDVINAGIDGGVYLCDTAKDACKFLAIRGVKRIYVFEVEVNEIQMVESLTMTKVSLVVRHIFI